MAQSRYKKRFTLCFMLMGILALVLGSSSAVIAGEKKLDVAICAFDGPGKFNLGPPHNPYFPLSVGSWWQLEGEEDDEFIELLISVEDEIETINGVNTRVVIEAEWVEGDLIEVSRNFFAYIADGTACYFGEDVFICESGFDEEKLPNLFCDDTVSNEGAWRAGVNGAFPGIFMPGEPKEGQKFVQEGAPGIAEDEAKIIGQGSDEVEAGSFDDNIRFREYNPLDEEKDYKVFNNGVSILRDGPLELIDYFIAP